MSFSLKSIEDMGFIASQSHGSAFYREAHASTLWCQPGEVIQYCPVSEVRYKSTMCDRRPRHLLQPQSTLHVTSDINSQSDIDAYMGFNQNKLKTSTKLKPPQLNPF